MTLVTIEIKVDRKNECLYVNYDNYTFADETISALLRQIADYQESKRPEKRFIFDL